MANNLVVQLLLKTGTFSTDLKTAKGQIQSFQKGCQTAGQSVSAFSNALGINVGALTKMGGAVGAAVLAGKELKAIIDSTQTSADAFQGVIAGCTGVLETFNTSIARADFSAFTNGLWSVYDAAKAARDAIDALQDAQLGYGMISSDNQANFATAQNNYREAKTNWKNAKTKEERDKWSAEMEKYKKQMEDLVEKEEEAARNFHSKNMDAIKTTIMGRNPLINEKDITEAAIMEAARIFNSMDYKQEKQDWKDRANAVKSGLKDIPKKNTAKRQSYLNDYDRQFALVMDELLELPNKKIQAVAQEFQSGKNAKRSAESMRRTFIRTTGTETEPTRGSGGGTPKVQKDELEIMENSLTYWRNILANETKYRDALEKNTDEWNVHNNKVIEAQEKIKEIEGTVEKLAPSVWNSLKYWNDELAAAEKLKNELAVGTDEYNEQLAKIKQIKDVLRGFELVEALVVDPPTIQSLETVLSLVTQIRNETAIGSEEFEMWGEVIENVKKQLDEAKGVKPELPAPETNQWEKFNQAMANTSTIVSSVSNTFKEGAEMTAASVLQMVATCLPAIGNLIAALDALTVTEAVEAGTAAVGKAVSTSQHWVEAIAAVASLSAVVAAAIAAASRPKTQKFAGGGIVGGNSFYGDRVTANVNSGEMILNRSQQARLFQMANSGGTGGQVEFHISGTELVGVLNNQNRKNNLIR